ncbi:MAG: sulfotransferase [Rhodospirillales bacterium]
MPPNPLDTVRALIAAGRLDEAARHLAILRKTRPRDPDLLNMSGVVALQKGKAAAAFDDFSKAASLAPSRQDLHHHRGEAARLLERWSDAADSYENALKAGSTRPATLRGLGVARLALGQADEAVAALDRAVAADGSDAAAWLKLAEARSLAGNATRAVEAASKACELAPGEAAAHNNLGVLQLSAGQAEAAVTSLRRAVDLALSNMAYRGNLAAACRQAGRFDAALEIYESIPESAANAALYAAQASLLEYMNRTSDAGDAVARALALDPGEPQALVTRAILLRRDRQYEAALACLDRLEGRDDLDYELDASRHFEAGTDLDRLGRYADAWQAFARCNEVHDRSAVAAAIDRDAFFRDIDNARSAFTPGRIASWPADVVDNEAAPVFLVGFPRSGTTLTEQILAAHPRIFATDERELVREAIRAAGDLVGGGFRYPLDIDRVEDGHLPAIRAAYREAVKRLAGEPGDRIVLDKLPLNLVHLGFIRRIFPEARILIALRDPRDVCLSALFQNFRLNTAMIQFLEIGRTADAYCAAMGLLLEFEQNLGLRTLRFRYEDVVADLEGEASRILEFLGLEWTGEMRAYAEKSAGRRISTPSARDVAAGLYKRALGRHLHYEEQLAPVAGRLEPFVRKLGYAGETD